MTVKDCIEFGILIPIVWCYRNNLQANSRSVLITHFLSNDSLHPIIVPTVIMASSDALPEKIATEHADLRVVSLQGLLDEDETAKENLVKACTDLGFFYLDCRDVYSGRVMQDVQNMYTLAKSFYDLPQEAKNKWFVDRDHDEDLVMG